MTPNDATPDGLIDRRSYLRLAGGLAAGATAGLAGCSESVPGGSGGGGDDGDGGDGGDATDGTTDSSTSTGLLSTAVSDDPGDIGDFESCMVTLDGIWVGPKTGGEGDDEAESEEGDEEEADGSEEETDDGETNETEQTDEDGGQAEGNSSSEDSASGSQDGNQSDTDDDTESDSGPDEATDDEETEQEDEEEEEEEEEGEEGEDEDEDEGDGEEAEDGDSGGRTYYEFDEPQEADLTKLQGEAQQLVGEHELEVGTYQFLQLDVAGVRGTLTDGSEAEVTTPGNAPLKFNQSFDVREGYRTTFLADFTPVKRGNGSYLFKPVAAETEVSYEEIGGGDGGSGDDDSTNESTTDNGNTTDDGNTTDVEADDTQTSDGNETDDGGNSTSS